MSEHNSNKITSISDIFYQLRLNWKVISKSTILSLVLGMGLGLIYAAFPPKQYAGADDIPILLNNDSYQSHIESLEENTKKVRIYANALHDAQITTDSLQNNTLPALLKELWDFENITMQYLTHYFYTNRPVPPEMMEITLLNLHFLIQQLEMDIERSRIDSDVLSRIAATIPGDEKSISYYNNLLSSATKLGEYSLSLSECRNLIDKYEPLTFSELVYINENMQKLFDNADEHIILLAQNFQNYANQFALKNGLLLQVDYDKEMQYIVRVLPAQKEENLSHLLLATTLLGGILGAIISCYWSITHESKHKKDSM